MFPFRPTIVSALVLLFVCGFVFAQYRPSDTREMDWLELLLKNQQQNPFDPALEAKAARAEYALKFNKVQMAMNDLAYDFNANIRNDKRFEVADKAIDVLRKDPGWGSVTKKKRR